MASEKATDLIDDLIGSVEQCASGDADPGCYGVKVDDRTALLDYITALESELGAAVEAAGRARTLADLMGSTESLDTSFAVTEALHHLVTSLDAYDAALASAALNAAAYDAARAKDGARTPAVDGGSKEQG